jgi:hypothetical protein
MEFFASDVNDITIRVWQDEGKTQVICQAELLAVPVALQTWRQKLSNRDVIFFVDNEPAKDALIHGISSSASSSQLVASARLICAEAGLGVWYARVPSPSNIADAPSRGSCSELVALGFSRVDAVPPMAPFPISLSAL